MRVLIPSPLRSYTNGAEEVSVDGATVREVAAALDAKFPGIRFRMIDEQDRLRPHIVVFVGREQVDGLDRAVRPGDQVQIVCALSGG